MTDLVERVILMIANTRFSNSTSEEIGEAITNITLEEAAKVAEAQAIFDPQGTAAAIRALGGKDD